MVRMGMVMVLGGVVASMAIAMYAFTLYQPNIIEVHEGEPVVVGPVEYTIIFEGTHDGSEEVRPENTFVKIRVSMLNRDVNDVGITGGQFFIVDVDGTRHQPIYGNGTFSNEDLLLETLLPDRAISRTTQFDIPFDDSASYQILIRPAKEHATSDAAIVCLTNC